MPRHCAPAKKREKKKEEIMSVKKHPSRDEKSIRREGGSTIFGSSPAFRVADAHGFRIEHVVYEGYALEPESQQGAMPRRYLHVVDEAEFA